MDDEKILAAAKLLIALLDAGQRSTLVSGVSLLRCGEGFAERLAELERAVREDGDMLGIVASLMNGGQLLAQVICERIGKDYASEVLKADLAVQEHASRESRD